MNYESKENNVFKDFEIGDKVFHKTYGNGAITSISEENTKVKFNTDNYERELKQDTLINKTMIESV